jgi:predicted dehydrogenase
MGTNQHLIRSIQAIREQGGLQVGDDTIWPDPILVGRNRAKLEALAKRTSVERVSTNLDECLANPDDTIYFDAQLTQLRAPAVKKAIEAGKHVYCEKPTGVSTEEALELVRLAEAKGVKHGVVQDKLWLPGLLRLKQLIDTGYFGRILSVRGEFGYWVFTGFDGEPQRPSWNYRKEDGGGIMVDMLCHWRYVLDNLFGNVKSVSSLGAIHIPKRKDEQGNRYDCTADDSAYSTFELEDKDGNQVIAHFNSSWTVRVRRDDLLSIQVDGTNGSAVAGLRECVIQPHGATPRPTWNPDIPKAYDYLDQWMQMPAGQAYGNAFKVQWEMFLEHVVFDTPWVYGLMEGAKGVQLAERGLQSWEKRAWVDVEKLEA